MRYNRHKFNPPPRSAMYKIVASGELVEVIENAAVKTIDGVDFVPIKDTKGATKLMRKDCLAKCSSHEA